MPLKQLRIFQIFLDKIENVFQHGIEVLKSKFDILSKKLLFEEKVSFLQKKFLSLSKREQVIVSITSALFFLWILYVLIETLIVIKIEAQDELQLVQQKYDRVVSLRTRYEELSRQHEKLSRSRFSDGNSIDQIYSEIDSAVKETLSGVSYDLKRSPSGELLSRDVRKQEFVIRIASVQLEQILKLLYRIENGKTPMYVSRLETMRLPQVGAVSATITLATLEKSSQ